jgi:hypothetical protein
VTRRLNLDTQAIIAMHAAGETMTRIAARHRCSPSTIYNRLAEVTGHPVAPQPRWESRLPPHLHHAVCVPGAQGVTIHRRIPLDARRTACGAWLASHVAVSTATAACCQRPDWCASCWPATGHPRKPV